MKRLKKITAILLALAMVFALGVNAFAAYQSTGDYTITITPKDDNNMAGGDTSTHTYEAYQVFKGEVDMSPTGDKHFLSNITWGSGVKPDDLITALKSTEVPAPLTGKFADIDASDPLAAQKVAEVLAKNATTPDFAEKFADVVNGCLETSAAKSFTQEGNNYTCNVTEAGYYFIKDQDNSGATALTDFILQVVQDVSVKTKSDAPSLEKKIVDEEDVDGDGEKREDTNTASIGDTIKYELKSKVPAMDGYVKYFYVIEDTLSKGLTFKKDVKVTIDGKELTPDTDYSVKIESLGDEGEKIVIVFKNFVNWRDKEGGKYVGKDIVVTYSAELNKDAIVGENGNPNTVHLLFSNDPNTEQNGKPDNPDEPVGPTGTTPDDTVYTFTTGLKLIKVDSEDITKRLSGAEFTITGNGVNHVLKYKETFEVATDGTYYKLKDGTYTTTAPTDDTADKYAECDPANLKYKIVSVYEDEITNTEHSVTITIGETGELIITGLNEGQYTIHEATAPDGYNVLEEDIIVDISAEIQTDEPPTCTWSASITSGNDHGAAGVTDGIIEVTVKNNKGIQLPETGGIGTTIFYIVGGGLLIAALAVLVSKILGSSKKSKKTSAAAQNI